MTGRMGEAECLGEDSWVEGAGDPRILCFRGVSHGIVQKASPQKRDLAIQERDKEKGTVCAESGWAESRSWRPQSTQRN